MIQRHERSIHHYSGPVSTIFKEKNDGTLQGQQNKVHQILTLLLARKIVRIKNLYEGHRSNENVRKKL